MGIDRARVPDDRRPDDADRTTVVERVETRVDDRAAYAAAPQTNVNAAPVASPVWTLTRVVTLIFTVLEVLLLFRFLLKLFGANQSQPLVAGLYGLTDPLVRPFEGIFAIPPDAPFDIAALLAIVFLFLVAALIVALVKAIAGRTA
jgi:YggT family protein